MAKGRLITIGSFDGVHLGHAALLERSRIEAHRRHLKTLALTFQHPPRMILDRSKFVPLLSTSIEKEYWIRSKKIDEVIFLKFDKKFSKVRPFGFFRDVLVRKYKAKGVVVGLDFRFGQNRMAGANELVRWGQEFEIPIWVIPPVRTNRTVVSSTEIRRNLTHNRFRKAIGQLGHNYLIAGKVKKGQGLGKKIGYATANLDVPPEKSLPTGVFAVTGWPIKGKGIKKPRIVWKGVCNIGTRPTVSRGRKVVVEAHFFNKSLNLRGKQIAIELIRFLRREKRFKNNGLLARAITRDIRSAKAIFSKKR